MKETFNMQAAFDTVARGIVEQGGPSMNGEYCAYRSQDGRKCAAGLLIPDASYDPAMESKSIGYVLETFGVIPGVTEDSGGGKLLASLQAAHDDASGRIDFFRGWGDAMRSVARRYSLSADALEAALAPFNATAEA